jgi:hypothetical protein
MLAPREAIVMGLRSFRPLGDRVFKNRKHEAGEASSDAPSAARLAAL